MKPLLKSYFHFEFVGTFGAGDGVRAFFYRQSQHRLTPFAGAVALLPYIANTHKVCSEKPANGVYYF